MKYEFPGGPSLVLGLFGLLWTVCGAYYAGAELALPGIAFLVLAAVIFPSDRRQTKHTPNASLPARPGRGPSLAGGISGIVVILSGIVWMVLILYNFEGAGMFSLFGLVFVLGGSIQAAYHFRNRAQWQRRPENKLPESTRRIGGILSILVCALSLAWIAAVRGTELSVTAWIAVLTAVSAAVQTARFFRK